MVFTFVLFPIISIYIFAVALKTDKKTNIPVHVSQVTPLVVYMQQTMQAWTPTPSMTATITPTFTPTEVSTYVYSSPTPVVLYFRLSFYDPNIGRYFPDKAEVNCLQWDFEKKECHSKLLGGTDVFSNWYGRGLACPAEFPFYTKFQVVNPPQLAGLWTCVDRGGLIVGNWLDFLLRYPDQVWTGYDLDLFPWAETVEAVVTFP